MPWWQLLLPVTDSWMRQFQNLLKSHQLLWVSTVLCFLCLKKSQQCRNGIDFNNTNISIFLSQINCRNFFLFFFAVFTSHFLFLDMRFPLSIFSRRDFVSRKHKNWMNLINTQRWDFSVVNVALNFNSVLIFDVLCDSLRSLNRITDNVDTRDDS